MSSRAGWEMGAVPRLYLSEDAHGRLWWPRLTRVCEVGGVDERIDGEKRNTPSVLRSLFS